MKIRRPSASAAFTLVEILLVTTLIAGLSLAIFSCLSNGLRLWDRSRLLMVEEDAAFFFDRFSSDVRNSYPFSSLLFSGTEHELAFPTVVLAPADRAGSRAAEGYADGLGRVQYMFEPVRGELVRRQANYSQALRAVWGESRVMVTGLTSVRFKYLVPGSGDYRSSHDPADPFPAGIEVAITFMNGSTEKVLRRFVPIPAGLQ
ncbi:MAG: hypothetical protein HQL22_05370 [Candidatus Omnitrophica bacterium]|nr:hypothetical protein [Candidatus Omnitrophota bacterium]